MNLYFFQKTVFYDYFCVKFWNQILEFHKAQFLDH